MNEKKTSTKTISIHSKRLIFCTSLNSIRKKSYFKSFLNIAFGFQGFVFQENLCKTSKTLNITLKYYEVIIER